MTAAVRLVADALQLVRRRLGARTAERVVADVAADMELLCDGELVAAALAEALGNALAFSPGAQPVEIGAQRTSAGQVRFRVADGGCGIPETKLAAGLDSFHAFDPTGGGAGLGILIARTVMERHGGHFGIVSEAGAGTEAFLSFPDERRRPGHAR
jgi:signal transduction histidine kinase